MTTKTNVIPEHIEHRITLPDGRTLAAAEWGDPDGLPLLALHGTPGGRIGWWWRDPEIDRRYGMRRITYDRPGYGESTRHRGRRVADAVSDIEHLTAALGIDRFVVAGGSGGGPHALACAALLGDRVVRCLADVSVAPFDAEGLDWLDGMTEGNLKEFAAAREGEKQAAALCEDLRLTMVQRLHEDRLDFMGDDYELSPADMAQMQKEFGTAKAHMLNGIGENAHGWVDDLLVFTRPWGFDVRSIGVPVLLVYGRTDVLVPAAHGDWLTARIPGAVAWVSDEAGHLGDDEATELEYAWLAGRLDATTREPLPA